MLAPVPSRPGIILHGHLLLLSLIPFHVFSLRNAASYNKQASRGLKVIAVLYKGGNAAKEEPRLLGTVENEVRTSPFVCKL